MASLCNKSCEGIYKWISIHMWTISIWIAWMVKQVKITPYLFTRLFPRFTRKRPKQSTPTNVNGGLSAVILSAGRSSIFCLHGTSQRLWQSRATTYQSANWQSCLNDPVFFSQKRQHIFLPRVRRFLMKVMNVTYMIILWKNNWMSLFIITIGSVFQATTNAH